MLRHSVFAFVFLLLSVSLQAQKPGIGLALSGGGAKGLIHIGILEAIDSAGLHIDYLTGTSMGSVVGGLYAAGYTGKQIEAFAQKIDWNNIFSGTPAYRNVSIEEKAEFQSYAVELPLENGTIKIQSGFMEAEELWLGLGEMFFPVYDQKDYTRFDIPFKCVAADLSNGMAVVMDKGEIVKSVRSSMAIPSVFTAIDYQDTKLVDGGVVRNFPVSDLIAMGANYCIGVNLSNGLEPPHALKSYLDVLLQISSFRDYMNFDVERKLCNLLIEPPIGTYSAASFSSSAKLIALGKEVGRAYYPQFKKLADSLLAIDYRSHSLTSRLPIQESVIIDSIAVTGLKITSLNYFTDKLNIRNGKSYTARQITEAIRKTYGSRRYTRIAFFFDTLAPGHALLRLEVIENPAAYIKAGLHYHSYTNFSAIGALSFRDFLIPNSNTLLKFNIGDNPRIMLQHLQPLFKPRMGLFVNVSYDRTNEPLFRDHSIEVVTSVRFFSASLALAHQFSSKMYAGIGANFRNIVSKPKVDPVYNVRAENSYWNTYLFLKRNTLDRKYYPREGYDISAKAAFIFAQDYKLDSIAKEQTTVNQAYGEYLQFQGKLQHYLSLSNRACLATRLQLNLNYAEKNVFMNAWSLGGLTEFMRNQVTFSGLQENEVTANSLAVLEAGYRRQLTTNFYLSGTANAALYSFAEYLKPISAADNFLSGYAVSLCYDSPIGPLEVSAMYCDQSKRWNSYVNIGYHF